MQSETLQLLSCSSNMATKFCILQIFFLVSSLLPVTYSIDLKLPAVFNFGDSNSDTGELIAAGIETLDPPNGQTYFQTPSGRYCDGRLIIDFLSTFPTFFLDYHHPFMFSVCCSD